MSTTIFSSSSATSQAIASYSTPLPTRVPIDTSLILPRRVDVHSVGKVVDQLETAGQAGAAVIVDGSAVEMIDLAALDALTTVAIEVDLRIERPTVALLATVELTGHDVLARCCDTSGMKAA